MEFGPIFRALMRNKTGAILIALQIAFTMTVSLNAWVMIENRTERASRPSGMNETDTFHLESYGYASNFNARVTVENDLRQLRDLDGIVSAVQMNAIPLSGSGWSTSARLSPDEKSPAFGTAIYFVDERGIETLGTHLIAGENFTESDVTWRAPNTDDWPPKTIVTRALAAALFPNEDPLAIVGRSIIVGDAPKTIVGIIDKLQMPWGGNNNVEHSLLRPQRMEEKSTRYLIRAQPGQRDLMMAQVEAMLLASNPERIIRNLESMEDTRKRSYSLDVGLSKVLGFVMVVLLLITGFGILGLASFSVRRRIKQIGVRRALGARQADIKRYFLVENLLITGAGVILGAFMTVGFNIWLVQLMNFPKIEWYGIPLGVVLLIALGQLAVLGPATRACRVSPATATRTV